MLPHYFALQEHYGKNTKPTAIGAAIVNIWHFQDKFYETVRPCVEKMELDSVKIYRMYNSANLLKSQKFQILNIF